MFLYVDHAMNHFVVYVMSYRVDYMIKPLFRLRDYTSCSLHVSSRYDSPCSLRDDQLCRLRSDTLYSIHGEIVCIYVMFHYAVCAMIHYVVYVMV